MKKVSVLIPAYNVGRYLSACLDSIVCQTYENLEIVVVNDGSSDDTVAVIKKYAAVDARIVFVDMERNVGIVGALNAGLNVATGYYIARMDGDDISDSDRIRRQVEYLEKNAHIDLVGVWLRSINNVSETLGESPMETDWRVAREKLKYGSPVAHVWVCRKALYDLLGGYRNIPGCEDYDFLLRAAAAGKKFENIPHYYGYSVRLGRPGNTVDVVGLRQKKAKRFAYKLYRQRLKNNTDQYSELNLQASLRSSALALWAYKYSSKLFTAALLHKRNIPFALVLAGCSCLLYPAQLFYLFERWKMKQLSDAGTPS